jgi:hypothetical protein
MDLSSMYFVLIEQTEALSLQLSVCYLFLALIDKSTEHCSWYCQSSLCIWDVTVHSWC